MRRLAAVAAAGVLVAVVPLAARPAGASARTMRAGLLPPAHPAASLPADPAYEGSCSHPAIDDSSTCRNLTLAAIDNARAKEGLGAMVLPHNWTSLSHGQQLFTAINIERVDRGLAPMTGMVAELNTAAAAGAAGLYDAFPPSGYPFTSAGSLMAGGQSSVLGAMYEWMYFDGLNSHNPGCTATVTVDCWGHRDIILGGWGTNPGTVGAATASTTYLGSPVTGYAAMLVGDTRGTSHSYTFTWAHELPYFGDVPSAPGTPKVAVVASRTVKASWSAPYYRGTSALTRYRVTLTVDGVARTPIDVGPSTTSATFSVPDGTAATVAVVATNGSGNGPAAVSGPAVAPFATVTAFVTRQYQDVLGRAPSGAELLAGVAAIQAGQTPAAFVAALRTGADATTNVDPATRLYFAYFLRIPDRGGLDYWVAKRRRGTTLYRISESFARSSEFQRRYGTLSNKAFVELIYRNVLGRAGDASGVSYWTRQLDSRRKGRGQVMVNFSESSEYVRKSTPSVQVAVAWIQLLAQSPDRASFDDQVAQLGDGSVKLADLVGTLLDDDRYATLVA